MIWYFRDGLRLSISTQIHKRDRDLKNSQEVLEKTIDTKAKASQQTFFPVRETNTCYLWSYWLVKDDKSRDQKNLETKKTPKNFGAHQTRSNNDDQSGQSKQATGWLAKKNSRPCYKIP